MSARTPILAQEFIYDKAVRAWGRYDAASGELLHYHNSLPEAVRAALPTELAEWAAGQPDQRRALKAAQLIANGEVRPDTEAFGLYGKSFIKKEDGVEYRSEYVIDVRAGTCTCPDFTIRQAACKHLLAAGWLYAQYNARLDAECRAVIEAEAAPAPAPTLWDLARAAVEAHAHDDPWLPLIIWRSNGRYAEIHQGCFGKPDDPLWLHLSGHAAPLMIARRCYDGWPGAEWLFVASAESYAAWVAAIRNS